jgi:2-methylcitrate dehydratase
MVAIGLLKGELSADDYEEEASQDPRIDALREKMQVIENKQYSIDYHDPDKRSIANALTIRYKDGSSTERIAIEYPLGHRRRREESIPLLFKKFEANLSTSFSANQGAELVALFRNSEQLEPLPISELINQFSNPFSS